MEQLYDQAVINQIKHILLARTQTIAVAESVTSGHLQVALSQAEDARKFYQGGITTYNLGQKTRHLNVNPIQAIACNSVSASVAESMASNVAINFTSNWGVGVTGYAAPVPQQGIEDLFCYYAFYFDGKIVCSKLIRADHDKPFTVQLAYTNQILSDFLSSLTTL